MVEMELTTLLEDMISHKASDLFLSVGANPLIKVEGVFKPLASKLLNSQHIYALCYSVLNDEQRKTFERTRELNMSLQINPLGRFRLNLFRQKGEPALVARHIKSSIPDLDELNLPDLLRTLIMEERGLVLLVGGTGTGKSSTLAAMLDYRNQQRSGHILTIEDPVEFIHDHKNSLVNQREIGLDTDSYEVALRNAMREAPDVIMIGEIRDMETMKHALAYAETGHLCVSTLHANNANQAIERILNFFPDTAHAQILQDLAINLKAIVSQRLTFGLDGKRVPAVEIMLNTPYISELIHFGKIEKLKEAMIQANELGCRTLDDSLFDLVQAGKISHSEALKHADSRTNLSLRFKLEGGSADQLNTTGMKKDVVFAKQVNFRTYKSFRVKCARFNSVRQEIKEQIETALRCSMEVKGFEWKDEHPDIEVQYAFNAQPVHMELEPVVDRYGLEHDKRAGMDSDNLHETLVVNMFDMHLDRLVWRVTVGAVLPNAPKPQQQVNRELMEILEDFPPH